MFLVNFTSKKQLPSLFVNKAVLERLGFTPTDSAISIAKVNHTLNSKSTFPVNHLKSYLSYNKLNKYTDSFFAAY